LRCPTRRKTTLVFLVVAGLVLSSPATAFAQRIVIPGIGVDVRLAEQVDDGPWLYYRDRDTIAIAGHRTTHGHPFLHLPKLRHGDVVRVGQSTFVVRRAAIVRASEVWVLRFRGLVLSACHPPGTARYRYVVFALPAPAWFALRQGLAPGLSPGR
jgi:sortase (surface protein transpeptidase)